MKRITLNERPNWKKQAEELGFKFHTMYGQTYWDEKAAYQFSLEQIEKDIEDPSEELHHMCLNAIDHIVNSEELLTKLSIPRFFWEMIWESWQNKEPSLYGRFDLVYDGKSPAKMLEYNADTPTSLYESSFFQWLWLEENIENGALPKSADQYNSIQEKLIEQFSFIFDQNSNVHFASCLESEEDRQTVLYLEDCAKQAGLVPHYVPMEEIGVDENGKFLDKDSYIIQSMFKLYPWEDMMREEFGQYIPKSDVKFIEPIWKSVLSNKGILPVLWKLFPHHPNLLPAFFENETNTDILGSEYVRKPLFSREGANIEIFKNGKKETTTEGEYGSEGHIIQKLHPLPKFDSNYTVIGSWIVGNKPAGIGIREDNSLITRDLSRFLPHFIA